MTEALKILAKPTAAQRAWQEMEAQMFVHFGPATWQDQDNDDHSTPLKKINPKQLDAEQWCDVAESFGAKQIVLVAKHVGGFCWWRTETSNYGVKEPPWRGGKGDLVREVAEACSRRGLKLGIYLSPCDYHLGAATGGRCETPAAQERYIQVYRAQLTELLTRYGPVAEVWFDGSLVFDVTDVVALHAPDAIQFQGPRASIRWAGNEEGMVPYPAWNTVRQTDARCGIATTMHSIPDGDAWMPIESDTTIRGFRWGDKADPQSLSWFWKTYNESGLKSLEWLVETYYRSVGHGTVLLLNSNPDVTGRIPAADAQRVAELGAEIRRRFGQSVAETCGRGQDVELKLPRTMKIDHVILQEDIEFGHRVRKYEVKGLVGTQWKVLSKGSAIGHKKIDFFAAQRISKLRLRVVECAGVPLIRRFAAFYVGTIPTFKHTSLFMMNPMVVGRWDEKLTKTAITGQVDVSNACGAARQYELEFVPAEGATGPTVEDVVYIADGAEAPQFVARTDNPLVWRINVTGLGGKKELRITMLRAGEAATRGELVIRGQ